MRAHWSVTALTLLTVLISLSACGGSAARPESATQPDGRVISVADGDTLTILSPNKQKQRIRLAEIDTPERGQPWGGNAKRALSSMTYGQNISLAVHDIDHYGRVVATVYVDGKDVNAELVRLGHAWVYRQYLKHPELLKLEDSARQNKLGLWALPKSERIPPWQWRKLKRESQKSN